MSLDIVTYGRTMASRMREEGHAGNAHVYETVMNSLVRFVGRENISVQEITAHFLNDWIRWISEMPSGNGHARGRRAQSLYPATLMSVINRAKIEFNDEELGVIRIPLSPFNKIKLPKLGLTAHRALSADQIRILSSLPSHKESDSTGYNRFNFSRDMFLLSFRLIGMNEADLYNCTDFKNALREDKIPLVESINFYSARHSWATIAANDAGVDKYVVHSALNHVDPTMRVTDIYIKKSWDPIDRANRAVIDFVGKKCMIWLKPPNPITH